MTEKKPAKKKRCVYDDRQFCSCTFSRVTNTEGLIKAYSYLLRDFIVPDVSIAKFREEATKLAASGASEMAIERLYVKYRNDSWEVQQ